ncbi:NADPH-dependent ferric siderophore reductase, contains FAD-binding and SIP domains [Streptosporangium subroseum]|uniref:NADPH-dependent ferric siderophore reductase, contains FAD-binding and SIP domains n=1 Tax=Streptosporangium subroseum TaxID=106412 RepID=A0A239PBM6_9ACTN|nr:siderophore-interacting protein [Streptosporangium subroseum]SNT64332.1 NADPH-dependent ferric siderophore reductase, contains FAD-binding and SIP domains [Streptosporangium subroseum]
MSTAGARPIRRILDRVLVSGTVEDVVPVARHMRRIRIGGASLRDLDWTPGQHVRLQVGDLLSPQTWLRGFRDVLRTYSIWDYDPRGSLDLCILDHAEAGPGALWSRQASIGRHVAFTRPEGRFVPRGDAPYHLFVGDETAEVAFGAMLRALPGSARAYGAVAVGGPDDRLPLSRSDELTWVYRDSASPADTDLLVHAVRSLALPDHPGVAYVAGQARTCQAVREHLVRERGWPRDAVLVKAFWAPGKRGLD